jgi:Cdc6-like AAA superfamily ATPase
MPTEEVLFIDTERKTLPFRNAAKCKVKTVTTWKQFEATVRAGSGLMDFSNDKEKADYYGPIKVVIIDSFTRVLYLLSEHLKSLQIKGFDFWRDYGDMIEKMHMTWASKGRFIVFTALDEVVRDTDSIDRVVVKVEGKKLEGKIESFFTVVLHTRFNNIKPVPEAYQFCTNTDGKNTAKSPEGMFADRYIQNDLSFVLGSIYDYYDMASNPDFVPSPIIICGKSGTGKSTSAKYLFEGE